MKKILPIILFTFVIFLATVLRFYNISENPPGLYIDEVSIGYNAHTILTKGVDEHGERYPLMFKAFGEYKMPVYIYLVAGSEYFFGKNEFSVRFPSAFFGVMTVILFYFFIHAIINLYSQHFSSSFRKTVPLLGTFLLATSQWHIHFSRGGFEANVALFFYICAVFLLMLFFQKRSLLYLFLSALFFSLTCYTYFAYRVISPLTIIVFSVLTLRNNMINWKKYVIFFVTFLVLLSPVLISATASGSSRFSQTTAFGEYPVKHFWEAFFLYPLVYFKNYLTYFSLTFLFVSGDGIGRHQMPWFGLLPKWQLLFLLAGLYVLFKNKRTFFTSIVMLLLFVSPTAAAFAVPSPHALRSLSMVIPLTLLTAVGLWVCFSTRRILWRWITITVLLLASIETIFALHHYIIHYPRVNQLDWGGAYKAVIQEAKKEKNAIVVTDSSLSSYVRYYDESLHPSYGAYTDKELHGRRLVLVRPEPYKKLTEDKLIKIVYLPNTGQDNAFATLWEVKACRNIIY